MKKPRLLDLFCCAGGALRPLERTVRPGGHNDERNEMEQPTYEQLSGALLSVGLASAFGEAERSAKLKTLQALRDKKDTWCGYAEIELRQLIDSTLKEYKS